MHEKVPVEGRSNQETPTFLKAADNAAAPLPKDLVRGPVENGLEQDSVRPALVVGLHRKLRLVVGAAAMEARWRSRKDPEDD